MKHLVVVIAAALVPVAAASVASASHVVERVVAVVNEEIILESELEQATAAMYRGPDPESSEGKKQWEEAKHKALDQMIDGKLVQQQAVELKLSVTPDEVARAVQQVMEQNHLD